MALSDRIVRVERALAYAAGVLPLPVAGLPASHPESIRDIVGALREISAARAANIYAEIDAMAVATECLQRRASYALRFRAAIFGANAALAGQTITDDLRRTAEFGALSFQFCEAARSHDATSDTRYHDARSRIARQIAATDRLIDGIDRSPLSVAAEADLHKTYPVPPSPRDAWIDEAGRLAGTFTLMAAAVTDRIALSARHHSLIAQAIIPAFPEHAAQFREEALDLAAEAQNSVGRGRALLAEARKYAIATHARPA